MDRSSEIPDEAYRKDSRALKVRVDAYAVSGQLPGPDKRMEGPRAPRLIRNWYYTTDEPLSPSARIWESWGNVVELGLCGLNRYPFEDTYVLVDVIAPDPILAKANPRLEIVGEHDYAIYEHLRTLRVLRDVVLVLLAFCVIGLAFAGIRKEPERRSADFAD